MTEDEAEERYSEFQFEDNEDNDDVFWSLKDFSGTADSDCIATTTRINDTTEKKDSMLSRLVPMPNKAGMDGIDRKKVQELVYEASKDSRFFKNEQKKSAELDVKVAKMVAEYEKLQSQNLTADIVACDRMEEMIEAERNLDEWVVHVDMDSFYASVHERDSPKLKAMPMAVGSSSMLCTANYVARKFGVRSAMPGFIAKKLCPELVIIPLDFPKYHEASEIVREVFRQYDPSFCPMSLDEAFLNITKYLRDHPDMSANQVVGNIRAEIEKNTGGLTASAGLAANKLLAKVCSDLKKPNGQYELPRDRDAILSFMRDLAVRKIPGIGKVTDSFLQGFRIHTCGDLFEKRIYLHRCFTPISFVFLLRSSLGVSDTDVSNDFERKSIGVERTFESLRGANALMEKLEELGISLSEDLDKENLKGKTLTLKLKGTDFRTSTRSKTIARFIHTTVDIAFWAKQVLEQELAVNPQMELRLMGLRMTNLMARGETWMEKFLKNPIRAGDKEEAVCPVCGEGVLGGDSAVNRHVDKCLNMQDPVIKDSADTSNQGGGKRNQSTAKRKFGGIDDYFGKKSLVEDSFINFQCPNCSLSIQDTKGMVKVNRHLDQCLMNT